MGYVTKQKYLVSLSFYRINNSSNNHDLTPRETMKHESIDCLGISKKKVLYRFYESNQNLNL